MKLDYEIQVTCVEVTPEMRQALEPIVLEALQKGARTTPESPTPLALTLAQARAALRQSQDAWAPLFEDMGAHHLPQVDFIPSRLGALWRRLSREVHRFLQEEGGPLVERALQASSSGGGFAALWAQLFERRVLPWIREKELLLTLAGRRDADLLIELTKVWIKELLHYLGGKPSIDPRQFFFNIENEATATWSMPEGALTVHGRLLPCGVELRPVADGSEARLLAFRLASEGSLAQQIVDFVLTLLLVEHSGNVPCAGGRLYLLSAAPLEDALEPEVVAAFEGLTAPPAWIHQLQAWATTARRLDPLCLPLPLLLVGAGGDGPKGAAQRLARALGVAWQDCAPREARSLPELERRILKLAAAPENSHGAPVPMLLFIQAGAEDERSLISWINRLSSSQGARLHAVLRRRAVTLVLAIHDAAEVSTGAFHVFQRVDMDP